MALRRHDCGVLIQLVETRGSFPTRVGTTTPSTKAQASPVGSSRRARERRDPRSLAAHAFRFIPTRAGTTASLGLRDVGGERAPALQGRVRFIPTRAGTTPYARDPFIARGGSSRRARERRRAGERPSGELVHPDACGNDRSRSRLRRLRRGSSRRAREQRRATDPWPIGSAVHPDARGNDGPGMARQQMGVQFIPTRAGTTRAVKMDLYECTGSSRHARERPRSTTS